jgi:hypothetical protein
VLLATCVCAPAAAQIALGPGAIVARVRDAAGRPLAGALVGIDGPTGRQATTNASGIATFAALPSGRYTVSVSLAGYAGWSTIVALAPLASAPQVVAPQLDVASFANSGAAASVVALAELGAGLDPFAAHALTDGPATNVLAGPGGAAVSLDGTLPGESRVELDGIPLAGGAESPATVRFRNLIGLSGIDVDAGPFLASTSPRDAVAGVVNERTPAVDGPAAAGVDYGYDSAIGSFEHVRVAHAFGNLALAFDGVTGDATDRSSSLKARYAFTPGTSADFAIYTLQSTGTIGPANVSANAPAFSVGVRTLLGGGTLEARAFRSSLTVAASEDTPLVADETARANGLQVGYDLPLGDDRVGFSFDRRSQIVALGTAPAVRQTFTTAGARGTFALARGVKLEVADAYSGGTLVDARHDPQLAIALAPTGKLSFRLAAGSDFATAPDDVLANRSAASPPLPPETAFGYRATAKLEVGKASNVSVTTYSERRFDLFAPQAFGANRGVGVGFDRTPPRGFGALAYVALTRSYFYGAAQPAWRDDPSLVLGPNPGEQLAGESDAKERFALTFRSSATCEERFGATLLGDGNAVSSHPVTLAEASLCATIFGLVNVRVGEENLFGAAVSDRLLAPLYVPHELTFSLGTSALR